MPGYHAKKRLGQNFLKSETIVRRIIETLDPQAGETIVEVGPGRGALTLPLAETGVRIVAVEFDRDMMGYLGKLLRGHDNVSIINTDFLTFDPGAHDLKRIKLVGNLPFNLSSPVMEWTARHVGSIDRAVFMVQKEVAERICAEPGGKGWSPLAIFTQLVYEARIAFEVGPKNFSPPPKVMSAVIQLTPRPAPLDTVTPEFETVVRASFRQRRKQLVNNLTPEPVADADGLREVLSELDLPANSRAEQLSITDFFNLTRRLIARRLL